MISGTQGPPEVENVAQIGSMELGYPGIRPKRDCPR